MKYYIENIIIGLKRSSNWPMHYRTEQVGLFQNTKINKQKTLNKSKQTNKTKQKQRLIYTVNYKFVFGFRPFW